MLAIITAVLIYDYRTVFQCLLLEMNWIYNFICQSYLNKAESQINKI